MVKIFDKQKYLKYSGGEIERRRECEKCGKFTKVNTKMLTYWDKYCFSCGEKFV